MARIVDRRIQTEVRLQASPIQGGGYDRAWRLSIEDARSGSVLAEVTLNPTQLFDLMTTRHTDPAPAEVFLGDHIGKFAESAGKSFRREEYDEDAAAIAAVVAISAERGNEPPWRAWSVSPTNKGTWQVGLVRYHRRPVERADA